MRLGDRPTPSLAQERGSPARVMRRPGAAPLPLGVKTSVVVVGNGVSGYACAARLAERDVAVTMIGPGLPHDRPPLSKRALTTGRVPLFADASQLVERGIEHLDGIVTACDLGRRRIVVTCADGGAAVEIEAPALVWATGLRYPRPPVPGFEQAEENATAPGLAELHRRLELPGRRVVVVGAGLIGTETAATLSSAHDVTLVDMVERPLARLLPRVSEVARDVLDDLGVRFLGSCRIDSATLGRTARSFGRRPTASFTATSSFRPPVFARAFRLSSPALTGGRSRLPADEQLRVIGYEGVWACGDCVSFPHPRWGHIAIPHWDHALWSGRHAADSILGSDAPYLRDPYFFSDIGPLRIQQVGLADAVADWHEEDGLEIGLDASGAPACVLLLNAPARLREARELVESGVTRLLTTL